MITASFRHIQGIGPLRERQLWFSGMRGWADVPAEGEVISPRLDGRLRGVHGVYSAGWRVEGSGRRVRTTW